MVNSIGEFTTKKDRCCEVGWRFKIPISNRLLENIALIGDKEFSDFNNLIDAVRKTTKDNMTKTTVDGNPMYGVKRVDTVLKHIEGDFSDGLIVNYFGLVFKKVK